MLKIVRAKSKLKFKYPLHAAWRAFIYQRDGYTCLRCGDYADNVPADYNGRETLRTASGDILVIDHKLSIRRGGTNHPNNLQTLCDSCNASKSCLEEGAGGVYA